MEKHFKYIVIVITILLFVGIIIALGHSDPDEIRLKNAIAEANKDLPRKIGTIGILDSITYSNKTISYSLTVNGNPFIQRLYKEKYDQFGELFKYNFIIMNGQRDMGRNYASLLYEKGLDFETCVYTKDGDVTKWRFSGKEIKDFLEHYKISPSEAFMTVIDMQLEMANIELPITLEDFDNPVKSIVINSMADGLDKSCLPQAYYREGNNIFLVYSVDEKEFALNEIESSCQDERFVELLAETLSEDADTRDFFRLLAISHSNFVHQYVGRTTKKTVTILFPYQILRKYSSMPDELLTNN